MVQVHFTIDLEGVSDPKIIELMKNLHDKMHPIWQQVDKVSWSTNLCVRSLKKASLQKTRDRAW